jgi:flagellar L-ring protein precursor FlgH
MANALLIAACLFCSHREQQPAYAPAPPPAPPPPVANGAIFQPANGYAPLTSGQRAAQVGDVITIVLVERTQGTSSSTSATDHDASIGLSPPTTGPLSFFNATDAAVGANSTFNGHGQTGQSNSLVGEISVVISEVLPNGTMRIRGEKLLRINRGNETIRISGIVRPGDIAADNRVASTRVADARIDYVGRGEISRASRQGWLQRFFSMLSPL